MDPLRIGLVGVDRRQELMGLLQQVAGQGPVRLLGVPRASSRCTEASHHLHDVQQPMTLPARGHGPLGNVGPEIVRRPCAGDHGEPDAPAPVAPPPDPVGVADALGSVLEMRSTASVCRLNRPYFGFTVTPAAFDSLWSHVLSACAPCD